MSLATIVSNVAIECGYTVESNVISSTEVTTKQLVQMTQRVNKNIFEAYPWNKCYANYTFTLVGGQATYALPASFSWYQYNTFWNQSTRWRVLGPMSEQEYAEAIGFGLNTAIYQRFEIKGVSNNQILIYPTPGATNDGNTMIFQYIADRCVRPQQWESGQSYAANTYTFNDGNYYFTSTGGTTGVTAPTHTSGSASDGGVTWAYYNGKYDRFLADTDVSFFSENLVEQGVKELFAQIHGIDTIVPEFTKQLHEEFSRDNPSKIIYAGVQNRGELFARSGIAVFGTWI